MRYDKRQLKNVITVLRPYTNGDALGLRFFLLKTQSCQMHAFKPSAATVCVRAKHRFNKIIAKQGKAELARLTLLCFAFPR